MHSAPTYSLCPSSALATSPQIKNKLKRNAIKTQTKQRNKTEQKEKEKSKKEREESCHGSCTTELQLTL